MLKTFSTQYVILCNSLENITLYLVNIAIDFKQLVVFGDRILR